MLDDYKKVYTVATIIVASTGVLWFYLNHTQKKKKYQLPTKWEEAGTVAQVSIYPVKSAKPITMKSANATKTGLKEGKLSDRSFILLNEKGQMVTGREAKLLVTLKTEFENDKLTISSTNGENISVDINEIINRNETIINFTIRGERAQGIDCGNEVAEWLTKVLYNDKKKVRLTFIGTEDWKRKTTEPHFYEFPLYRSEDRIGYFDSSSYHFMTTESLKNLNSRLSKPIDFGFFRPCVVIGGSKAFDEDNWEFIKIGENAIFHVGMPCERCILTTIDPNSGEYSREHFEELLKYRIVQYPEKYAKLWKQKPIFGINVGIDVEGRINVGDKVYVSRSKTPHWRV